MLAGMVVVELLEEGELPGLRRAAEEGRGVEVEDPRFTGADERALIEARQPAVGVVLPLEGRQATGMSEHHVGGEIVRLASQAVAEP